MSLWIMNEINKRFLKDLFNLEMGSHRTLVTEQGDIQPNAVNDFSKTPSQMFDMILNMHQQSQH